MQALTGAGGYGDGVFGHRTETTVDMHNESIELAKDMREQCPDITITLKEDAADYIVKLNRESKAKRGLFDKNTQVLGDYCRSRGRRILGFESRKSMETETGTADFYGRFIIPTDCNF